MNIFISADIEGVCGVMAALHWDPKGAQYAKACEWMTQEVNAAVEGALEAGAKRIVVKDSHNDGTNMLIDQLHPAVELISGWGPLSSMVEGIDSSFQACFLIGYHARGATPDGTLAHTWSGNVLDLRINDQRIGETGWAAAFAGHFNVPISLVTGDDKLAAQCAEELPRGYQSVVTKTGWTYNAAHMRPQGQVRKEIREAAARAVKGIGTVAPYKPTLPATMTLRFRHWEGLHYCAAVPNVKRIAVDTFQVQVQDFIEAQKYFATLHRLARLGILP